MKVILAFALFIAVASAVSVPTCEQKNVVLKDALAKLAKEKLTNSDLIYFNQLFYEMKTRVYTTEV